MKRALLGFAIFLISFGLGWSVSSVFSEVDLNPERPVDVPAIESPVSELPVLLTDIDAEFDDKIDYAKRMKVKLLQAADFHSDEVPYRSGEKWLGLFRIGDSYYLKRTQIRVEKSKESGLFDTTVSTTTPHESVFLVRGSTDLRPGKVSEVFDQKWDEAYSVFSDPSPKVFRIRGHFWKLSVENLNSGGVLQKGSVLVLERDGIDRQVLRYLPNGCDDCSWSILWAGDLDHDDRLDLLLDLSGHYNSYEPTLFLSSAAKKGNLVGILAGFHGVGC